MQTRSATFGEFIREKRSQKGLSLRRFAELVDLSPTYISQIENGVQAPPTADRARAMAQVLGEAEDVVIVMAGRIPEDIAAILQERPGEMSAFIREASKLTSKQLLRVTEQLRGAPENPTKPRPK